MVVCERAREALLVDPLPEEADRVLREADAEGVRPRLVVDTHTHADHHSAGAAVAARLGVPYALHESTACRRATERLRDGQVIEVGDERVEVLHTPGHTGDSISLRTGRELLTGDFLFLAQEGAGRLDLPGGDAGAHWDSLRRLASLGDDLRVLPGHDYHGLVESTLGEERRRNPRFQQVSREEYEAWQRAVRAPTPDWMLEVIAANLGTADAHAGHHGAAPRAGVDLGIPAAAGECGAAPGACATVPSGRVPLVAPRRALERLGGKDGPRPALVDVREPWEHRSRRAPGTLLIPLATLPASLDRLPGGPDAEVLLICKTGGRSARAAEFLIENGWRRVFSVEGGTDRWAAEGLPVERG
jgi:glyoxylase-like metal-dependent hydrolase (beta-lactamase superfamily II)/rhodanese-related sulfurtransferase